jgi:hypothetical protein
MFITYQYNIMGVHAMTRMIGYMLPTEKRVPDIMIQVGWGHNKVEAFNIVSESVVDVIWGNISNSKQKAV